MNYDKNWALLYADTLIMGMKVYFINSVHFHNALYAVLPTEEDLNMPSTKQLYDNLKLYLDPTTKFAYVNSV